MQLLKLFWPLVLRTKAMVEMVMATVMTVGKVVVKMVNPTLYVSIATNMVTILTHV